MNREQQCRDMRLFHNKFITEKLSCIPPTLSDKDIIDILNASFLTEDKMHFSMYNVDETEILTEKKAKILLEKSFVAQILTPEQRALWDSPLQSLNHLRDKINARRISKGQSLKLPTGENLFKDYIKP